LSLLATCQVIVRFVPGDQQALIWEIAVETACDIMTAAWKVLDIDRVRRKLDLF